MNTKEMKGITLVALVVTIVVLLILAGVSINLVLGNNGIIAKAKDAETKSAEASENDLKGMNSLIEQMESTLNGSGNGGKTEPETVPYLPSDDFHYDTSTSIDTGLVIKDGKGNELQTKWNITIELYSESSLTNLVTNLLDKFRTIGFTGTSKDANTADLKRVIIDISAIVDNKTKYVYKK